MSTCLMCSADTRKYKCSKCLESCCSFDCYKQHQVDNLCIEQTIDDPQCDRIADEPEPTQHGFKSHDTVPPENLARLKMSAELKNLLYNPHLRNFLRELDTDPRPWNAIQNAMQEPIFIEFANECLKIVEPETATE